MVRKEEHATVWQNSADTTQPIKSEKFQNEYQLGGRYISHILKKKKKFVLFSFNSVWKMRWRFSHWVRLPLELFRASSGPSQSEEWSCSVVWWNSSRCVCTFGVGVVFQYPSASAQTSHFVDAADALQMRHQWCSGWFLSPSVEHSCPDRAQTTYYFVMSPIRMLSIASCMTHIWIQWSLWKAAFLKQHYQRQHRACFEQT